VCERINSKTRMERGLEKGGIGAREERVGVTEEEMGWEG
jgi:hypothetical protein